jgi:hypothetical protein
MRLQVNRRALIEILKDPQVMADLERRGNQVAQTAGDGHRVVAEVGRNRARVAVITDTFEARRREATNRSLTSAIDAARR